MSYDARRIGCAKIVILIGLFERGGAERQAYLLARQLRRAYGLDVEVWALTRSGAYAQEFVSAGIPIRALDFEMPRASLRIARVWQWLRQLFAITVQLRKAQIDVLMPMTTWPNVVAGLIYRFAGVRLCIWGERHCGAERVPFPEQIAARQIRRFVANSSAGAEFLATEMKAPRELISVIPNGVEPPPVCNGAAWRARLGLDSTQPLVIMIANVTERKNHATLLRAWAVVQANWPGGKKPFLALAGAFHADETYAECERIIAEAGIGDSVCFLGSINDVPQLIAACDVAAFTSLSEGMPNAVLECMAAGKAVIASDLPGVRDVLGDHVPNAIANPSDAAEFAQKILSLLENSEQRNAIGHANRKRVEQEFSVERMVERHLEVVEKNLPKFAMRVPRTAELFRPLRSASR